MYRSHPHLRMFVSSVSSAWHACPPDVCVSGTLTSCSSLLKCHFFRKDFPDPLIKIIYSSVPSPYPPLPYSRILYSFIITWRIMFLHIRSPFTRIIRARKTEMNPGLLRDAQRLCLEWFLECSRNAMNVYFMNVGWNEKRRLRGNFYIFPCIVFLYVFKNMPY